MHQTLKLVKLFEDVRLPVKQNSTDSGFDLYAYSFKKYYQNEKVIENEQFKDIDSIQIACNDRVLIGTGIKATVGPGFEIQIRSRSGLALKQGLIVLNSPGTIDCTYLDEIGIILVNLSNKIQTITLGDRIAQMVVCPVILPEIDVVLELIGDNRGGGFGHTGQK